MAPFEELLAGGYCAAAALLALYFLCEHSACHGSQNAESLYLSGVLLLVYLASIIWGESNAHRAEELRSIYRLRQLMRLMLALHILLRFVFPRARPRFYGSAGSARLPAQQCAPVPTRKAKHKAQELEDLIVDVMEVSSQKALLRSVTGQALAPLLFLMLMLEDVMWAFREVMEAFEKPLLILVLALHIWSFLVAASKLRHWFIRRALIHDLLADLEERRAADVLQHVLATVNVGTLVEVASWSTVGELVDRGLQDSLLCTNSKAILIAALQMKGVRGKQRAHAAVRDLILSCRGRELTTLKNLIDGSGTYHNLYKLIYTDISNVRCRQEILSHLAAEAVRTRTELGGAVGVKVLSDIDDTLSASGGKFPAGCDRRFPRHTIYPGFLKLLQTLDRQWTPKAPSCNLVFLSARPHLYKDVTEERSFRLFHSLVAAGRMHGSPTLLPGRLRPGLFAMSTFPCLKNRAWRLVSDLKCATYLRFRDLYAEYDFVFFGDNGQGDLLAGQQMLEEQRRRHPASGRPYELHTAVGPGAVHVTPGGDASPGGTPSSSQAPGGDGTAWPRLLAVLIHRVCPEEHCLCMRPPAVNDERLLLYRSCVGAALALHRLDAGLVSAEQLAGIVAFAMEEFDAARWAHEKWGTRWSAAEEDLRSDLERAEAALRAAGLSAPPRLQSLEDLVQEAGWKRGWSWSRAATWSTVGKVKTRKVHARRTE